MVDRGNHMKITAQQARELYATHGSFRKAAEASGVPRSTIHRLVNAESDPAAHTEDLVPEGYEIRAMTVQRNAAGDVERTWTKTGSVATQARFESLMTTALGEVEPIGQIPRARTPYLDDLITVYPFGDPHLGMLSWKPETGADFDLKIASEGLREGLRYLLGRVPRTKHALILFLGDFFHSDGHKPFTPQSGHVLDVDGRLGKVFRVGIWTAIWLVEAALRTHDRVEVQCRVGNHDPTLSLMLQICLERHFAANSRVDVSPNDAPFYYREFGKCLFGATHGDRTKLKDLGEIMAHDQPAAWGRTRYRRWFVGHHHHEIVKEGRGWHAEVFRTMAAADAWHVAAGYRSGRDMRAQIWHREYGRDADYHVPHERLFPV